MSAPSKLDFNQVLPASYDEGTTALKVTGVGPGGSIPVTATGGGFVTASYDEIDLTYVASGNGAGQIHTVTYKLAGAPVATLTLSYDGSNNLITVIKS